MQYGEIGKSGIKGSIIGLGTWAIGGGTWWGETDDLESIRTIHSAIDLGITLIDTAPGYGFGKSEEVVGKALKGRRDKVVLSTKCGLWWNDSRGSFHFELEGKKVNRSLRPDTICVEIEDSLKRLGTDYIDIYHTHWQSAEPDKTPIEDTMECLMKLKQAGKIRSIAASNVSVEEVKQYMSAGIIDVIQQKYSMLDRAIENDIAPFCIKNDLGILAYSPLEQGLLTGKIGMDRKFGADEYRNMIPWFKTENRKRVLDMLNKWSGVTEKYKCTVSQLVLAWTANQPGISVVLCGARHTEQVLENVAAGDIKIENIDLERIRLDVEALGDAE